MSHTLPVHRELVREFEHRTTREATRFYGYLFENVKVLWYEAPQEVDSTDLFTRLNVRADPASLMPSS